MRSSIHPGDTWWSREIWFQRYGMQSNTEHNSALCDRQGSHLKHVGSEGAFKAMEFRIADRLICDVVYHFDAHACDAFKRHIWWNAVIFMQIRSQSLSLDLSHSLHNYIRINAPFWLNAFAIPMNPFGRSLCPSRCIWYCAEQWTDWWIFVTDVRVILNVTLDLEPPLAGAVASVEFEALHWKQLMRMISLAAFYS